MASIRDEMIRDLIPLIFEKGVDTTHSTDFKEKLRRWLQIFYPETDEFVGTPKGQHIMERLKKEIARMREELRQVRQHKSRLWKENERLKEELELKKKENKRLREELELKKRMADSGGEELQGP